MEIKKQLNKKIKNLELQLHTRKYIHIPRPSWKGIGKFSLTLFMAFLSVVNFLLILKIWDKFDLGYVFANEVDLIYYTPKFIDLIVLYPLVGEFILIGLTTILLASLFKELKSYKEWGLISLLVYGLILGSAVGLAAGSISGLFYGLAGGSIPWLIYGLVGGSTGGLIIGLIIGLIVGLIMEFD